jgi:crossover junction endonuclease EME1
METGQIKSGSNVEDSYHKMLQQIYRVTPQIADTITGTYKSVYALITAFQRGGPSILEGLQVFYFEIESDVDG